MLYSDNPKMDKSGITAAPSTEDMAYMGACDGPEGATGGRLYMEAIKHSVSKLGGCSDPENLKKMAGYVEKGYGPEYAAKVVVRENKYAKGK
tara:strand:+ start:1780 stop:2055 length:276 start_codon:yes stop_codon:yes gene_type:complete